MVLFKIMFILHDDKKHITFAIKLLQEGKTLCVTDMTPPKEKCPNIKKKLVKCSAL